MIHDNRIFECPACDDTVRYLLRGTTDGVRGDIVQEIISIVRQVASGPPPGQPDPLDDDMPGG
jgi:hypothetical protein